MNNVFLFIILLFLVSVKPALATSQGYEQIIVEERKEIYLNYYDLVELSKASKPQGELLLKLNSQLNSVIIEQPSIDQAGFLHDGKLGNFFRVATWNIERGFNVDRIIEIRRYSLDPKTSQGLKEELNAFSRANVIILNEVDIGMPRTNYENIAEKLSRAFKMGYVFGTEFIEVDPYQLSVKKFTKEERVFLEEEALRQLDNIQKDKFYGLHGTAILSKFPILSAKVIRLPDCYNWYLEESQKLSALELVRRGTAQTVFSSKILSELRHGGRIAIVADLLLPNKQKTTVVATHLEDRCTPECRYNQFQFLLYRLRNIRNPLILAGDLNTTGTDVSPISIKKEVIKRVKDPEYIARQAILSLTPLTLAQNVVLSTLNFFRNFEDPTTKNIPLLLPNRERRLFNLLKEFRFFDGGVFDIRGTIGKTYGGRESFLSNSNERDLKGFKPTFELEKHFGVAKYKLDWFFVKPLSLKNPNDEKGSYVYAPHFGRTLQELNRSFGKISDHDPIIVDIPIQEPVR